jgi:hypothetical protein
MLQHNNNRTAAIPSSNYTNVIQNCQMFYLLCIYIAGYLRFLFGITGRIKCRAKNMRADI